MKLPQGVEWSLHIALLLAQVPPTASISRRTLSQHHGLPEDYVAKYLKELVKAGIFSAQTGPQGGYRLARAAHEITVWEIVVAIDGEASPFHCQEIRQCGTGAASPEECIQPCAINQLMQDSFRAWTARLSQTTIADLLDTIPVDIRERNLRKLLAG